MTFDPTIAFTVSTADATAADGTLSALTGATVALSVDSSGTMITSGFTYTANSPSSGMGSLTVAANTLSFNHTYTVRYTAGTCNGVSIIGRTCAVISTFRAPANTVQISGTGQTGRDIGATLGANGAGLTALGDTRIANLDAAVSTRSTFAGGAVASVTAAVTLTSAYDAAKTAASQTSVNAIPTNPITSLAGIATSANVTASTAATAAALAALQTHGDASWLTATGFAQATELAKVPKAGQTNTWTNVSHDANSDTVAIS